MTNDESSPLLPNHADTNPIIMTKTNADASQSTYIPYILCCIPYSWISNTGTSPSNSKFEVYILLLSSMIGSGILAQPYCFMTR